VENLLAVAEFRQLCRAVGVTEVTLGPKGLRIAPVVLPESGQQLRIARLYPGSKYRPNASVLTLKAPTEGGRMGAALRDRELLGYLGKVVDDIRPVPAGPTGL
jgi:transcription-repair coupling factor (superfamily II helicase)